MLEISQKTNLLEQKNYKYSLQDVAEPNLYRELYPYTEVPRIAFNHRRVPMGMPEDIWITDTSFRDGQQSVEPYTVKQIVDLFKPTGRPLRHHSPNRIFRLQQKGPRGGCAVSGVGAEIPRDHHMDPRQQGGL